MPQFKINRLAPPRIRPAIPICLAEGRGAAGAKFILGARVYAPRWYNRERVCSRRVRFWLKERPWLLHGSLCRVFLNVDMEQQLRSETWP